MKSLFALLALLVLAGCTTLVRENLDQRYGAANPARYDTPTLPTGTVLFHRDVQPILNQRCVVCHSCYDAPCQLKLGSWEGVARGGSKVEVYNGTRLRDGELTRLFIDAEKMSQWREKGFFPVLNEFPTAAAELSGSLLARAIDLKAAHPPLPDVPVDGNTDFSISRSQSCSSVEEYGAIERNKPEWGMPFGLPALSEGEVGTLKRWLLQGAPYEGPRPVVESTQGQVVEWERFLNGEGLKGQLTARYIYEHLFLAHVYFEGEPGPRYFRLVRSRTAPGEPLSEIATRRPFDDPGVARVYYRLRPEAETIVAKSHMPYALSPARMARWRALFLQPDYAVAQLPGYAPALASNPFLAFRDLPVKARYRFMLEEAQFTVMGFIKGPVCRGQTALNVIDDHFWVFFQNPETLGESDAAFLERESRNLSLPAEDSSAAAVLSPWLRYSKQETQYLQAKSEYLARRFDLPAKVSLNMVWDGDGRNDNAALTIYRHFDSATVLKGLAGEKPKTVWILNYSLLERIHYLLVAGYDVFGNVGHQLSTRLYMDFLRMEGEFHFLALLPKDSRLRVRDYWYRGADDDVKDRVYGKVARFDQETGISYQDRVYPERELMDRLRQRVVPVLRTDHDIERLADRALRDGLQALAAVSGKALTWMPEASLLQVVEPGKPARTVTLVRNTAHRNVTYVLIEQLGLLPEENTLDVLDGYATAYPNAFYRVSREALPAFTQAVAGLASEADYVALMTRYGVRRSSSDFWPLSDAVNADYLRRAPIEAGWLDYNRLENR